MSVVAFVAVCVAVAAWGATLDMSDDDDYGEEDLLTPPRRMATAEGAQMSEGADARGGRIDRAGEGEKSDEDFKEAIVKLYEPYGPDVPFHNVEHGRNIASFAAWYSGEAGLGQDEGRLLTLAALSHDVMHPGGSNQRGLVEKKFVPKVHAKFSSSPESLQGFAADVALLLDNHGVSADNLKKALNGKSSDDVKELLMDKAPQEILHTWVTNRLLDDVGLQVDKGKVLLSILMTSITLHFNIKDHESHAKFMCSTFQDFLGCGLVLHLLDMGWSTQGSRDASLTFGPRFLMESGTYKKGFDGKPITNFAKVVGSEEYFAGSVQKYAKLLTQAGAVPKASLGQTLADNANEHGKIVASNDFKKAVIKIGKELGMEAPQWCPNWEDC